MATNSRRRYIANARNCGCRTRSVKLMLEPTWVRAHRKRSTCPAIDRALARGEIVSTEIW